MIDIMKKIGIAIIESNKMNMIDIMKMMGIAIMPSYIILGYAFYDLGGANGLRLITIILVPIYIFTCLMIYSIEIYVQMTKPKDSEK